MDIQTPYPIQDESDWPRDFDIRAAVAEQQELLPETDSDKDHDHE